jgi:hypothetical protein
MKKNKLLKTLDSKTSSVCNNCGNHYNETEINPRKITQRFKLSKDSINENWLTKQQNYLAHILEAQLRFGE